MHTLKYLEVVVRPSSARAKEKTELISAIYGQDGKFVRASLNSSSDFKPYRFGIKK